MAKKLPTPAEGFAFVQNESGTGFAWGGRNFEPNADGIVEAPIEALPAILGPFHGFALMSEAPEGGVPDLAPVVPPAEG